MNESLDEKEVKNDIGELHLICGAMMKMAFETEWDLINEGIENLACKIVEMQERLNLKTTKAEIRQVILSSFQTLDQLKENQSINA